MNLNAAASLAGKQIGQQHKKREETPTHLSWRKMRERCRNPNCRQWPWYGALGITVCERWETSFAAFLEDMGERPEGTTLDRLDGTKNYEPGNCRWATSLEQSRNQKHNVYVEYQGERVFLRVLCEQKSVPWMRAYQRIRSGWTVEEALSEGMHQKLAVKRGQPAGRAVLTIEQIRALRAAPKIRGGKRKDGQIKTLREWAAEFGVSLGCVQKAALGQTHAHIDSSSAPAPKGARSTSQHDTGASVAVASLSADTRVGQGRHSGNAASLLSATSDYHRERGTGDAR